MSLCRLARKNIRTFATKRMKQFMWIAMSTMILFFMISLQFNEGAILKVGDAFVFQMYFYTLFIVLIFICIFTTYKMMYFIFKSILHPPLYLSLKFRQKSHKNLVLCCNEQKKWGRFLGPPAYWHKTGDLVWT